jgi:ABC-2 type transport system permease protein
MRNIWTIAKREFRQYFISPVAYIVAFMLFLILGIFFYANLAAASVQQFSGNPYAPGIQVILGPFVTILLFTSPAITMRTLAEEQRMGTLELLLTAPVRDWELVVGKWLGAFLFMLVLIAGTWIYPIVLNNLVEPGIDQGVLVSGYLGLILMIGAILAIGVSISSLFNNQIAAFFAFLAVLLVLWLVGNVSQASGGVGSEILGYLDLDDHFFSSFFLGVIELKDIIYYLSVTVLALFLGTINVEMRRWR